MLAEAAASSTSIAGVLRHLEIRQSGGSHHHISKRLKQFGIDTSHFKGQGHNRGVRRPPKVEPDAVFVLRDEGDRRTRPHLLRRAMLAVGIPQKCEKCGISRTWQGRPITLHVDHINGNFWDNRTHNLRFLCPNCHSQTTTFAGRRRDNLPHHDVIYDPEATTPTGVRIGRRLPDIPEWSS
jgi:hypothetical protein